MRHVGKTQKRGWLDYACKFISLQLERMVDRLQTDPKSSCFKKENSSYITKPKCPYISHLRKDGGLVAECKS